MKRLVLLLVSLPILCGHAQIANGAEAKPDSVKGRTLLFVDNHHILYCAGTKRVLHPLQRYSADPIVPAGTKPWEPEIDWISVYRNATTGKYQLWYQAYAGKMPEDKTRQCTVCYAESDDGIHFTKPNLGLFDFKGSKETSIVLVANGGFSDRYGVSVVVDPSDADLNRRYKMAYFDFAKDEQGHESPGMCVAFSPDGIHWTKHPKAPLSKAGYSDYGVPVPFADEKGKTDNQGFWPMPLSMSDALDVFFDTPRGVFAVYGKMWIDGPAGGQNWKHALGRTESKDFIQWSQPQLVLAPDEQDPAWVEFHHAPVFFYNGCYFSAIQILDRATGGGLLNVELATSRDGLNWQRPFRKTYWFPHSEGNLYDSGSIFLCPQPVVLEDEIRFYYGAISQGATTVFSKLISGIGMATMRRDRFAGIQPLPVSDQPTLKLKLENIGQVTLKPLDLRGCKGMTVNGDASKGTIRCELLTEDGFRVRGYSKDDAVSLRGDSLRHRVAWKENDLGKLPSGRYMLRLHLENAEVFAVSFD
ncbi:MAG: hypothetical protein ABJC04_02370 [Verrucomicrobiota bacterium]